MYERLVEPGSYGNDFVILLVGSLKILRPAANGESVNDPARLGTRDKLIMPSDREPIFGFSACLTKPQWLHVKSRTDFWAVDAEEYSDTLVRLCTQVLSFECVCLFQVLCLGRLQWIARKDFYRCFSDFWDAGRPDMVELAYYHYQVGLKYRGTCAHMHYT
jgi:hypothetical protein